jgi:hypothetical protein
VEVTLLKGDPSLVSMSPSVALELLLEVEMGRVYDEVLWIREPQFFAWYRNTKGGLRLDGKCSNHHDAARKIFLAHGLGWREELLLKVASGTESPWQQTGFFVRVRGRRF